MANQQGIASEGDEVEVGVFDGAVEGRGTGFGVPVPEADGFLRGDRRAEENDQVQQQAKAAEDEADTAEHEMILASAHKNRGKNVRSL